MLGNHTIHQFIIQFISIVIWKIWKTRPQRKRSTTTIPPQPWPLWVVPTGVAYTPIPKPLPTSLKPLWVIYTWTLACMSLPQDLKCWVGATDWPHLSHMVMSQQLRGLGKWVSGYQDFFFSFSSLEGGREGPLLIKTYKRRNFINIRIHAEKPVKPRHHPF